MDFIKKSVTFSRFRVAGQFSFSNEHLQQGLHQNQFIDLRDKSDLENESYGWVSLENCLEPPQLDFQHHEPYLCLMLRFDRRSVSKTLLKAKVAQKEKAKLAELGRQRLSKQERNELKEAVRKELLDRTPISSALFRAVWNYQSQNCFLFASSAGAQRLFSKVFEKSFGLLLELQDPTALSHAWAKANNVVPTLNASEPTSFTFTQAEKKGE